MVPPRFFLLWLLATMVAGYDAASETMSVSTKNVHLRGNHVVERRQESSWRRLTAPTLTTTRCNAIHLEDYQAELQLVYSYLVEFAAGGSRSLSGIERAITHAVAQELDDCDIIDRPLYKVKTNTRHAFSKKRFCAPILAEGNTCQVVTGASAILLDSDPARALNKAYHAIKIGLNNTIFLDQFAPTVVRAEFLDEIRDSLVLSPDSEDSTAPGSVTASIAIAAASVSFVVASIFCYGIMRRENRNSSEPHIRHKNRAYRRSALTIQNPMGIQKYRRHFVRLDGLDESPTFHSPATFVTASYTNPQDYTPSITWSVSDMTSDSCSIYSSLSRTTSMLERIEEEEEAEEPLDEDDEGKSENYFPRHFDKNMTVPSYLYGRSSSRRIHVEDFDGAVFNEQAGLELSELEGCRYLDDSPDDGYGEICHVVTPIDLEDEMDDAAFMFTIEDDLEFSAEEDSIEDCKGDNSIDVDPQFAGQEAPAQDESLGTFECSFHSAHSMVEPTESEISCEFARKEERPTSVVEANQDLQEAQTQADSDASTLKHRDPEEDQPPAKESSDDDAGVGDDRNESEPNQVVEAEICNKPIEGGSHDPRVALEDPESETYPKTAETPKRRKNAQDTRKLHATSIEQYGTQIQETPAKVVLEDPESETHPQTAETPIRRKKSQNDHGLQDMGIEHYGTPMQEAPAKVALEDPELETHPKTAETPKRQKKAYDAHRLQDVIIENCGTPMQEVLSQVALEEAERETHPKTAATPKRRKKSQDEHGLQGMIIENYGTPRQESPTQVVLEDPESETHPQTAATPKRRKKSQDGHGLQGMIIENYGTPMQDVPTQVALEDPESETHPQTAETRKRRKKSQDGHGLQAISIENCGASMQEAPVPKADATEEVDAIVFTDSPTDDNMKEWIAHMMDGLVETAMEDT